MTEYHWIESGPSPYGDPPWLCLVPTDEPNPWSMRRIASIYATGNNDYAAAYHYPQGGGMRDGGGDFFPDRLAAKLWLSFKLADMSNPPAIVERRHDPR